MNDLSSVPSRRADWLAVLFALLFPTLITWVYFVLLAQSPPWLQKSAYGVGKFLQFAFPVAWVLFVQRAKPRWKWPEVRGLVEGLAFGVIVLLATLLLYHLWLKPAGFFAKAAEPIREKVAGFGVGGPWSYAGLALFYSLIHSFLEEYYWRWFVFAQLRRLIPLRAAIVVSSLGFMAHHVIVLSIYFGWFSLGTILFSLTVAVGGAVWAWMYERSGSLWGPWLSHLLVDAAIFWVGYDLVRNVLGT
jgi:membrane protease YdiL (CAAX protease family)